MKTRSHFVTGAVAASLVAGLVLATPSAHAWFGKRQARAPKSQFQQVSIKRIGKNENQDHIEMCRTNGGFRVTVFDGHGFQPQPLIKEISALIAKGAPTPSGFGQWIAPIVDALRPADLKAKTGICTGLEGWAGAAGEGRGKKPIDTSLETWATASSMEGDFTAPDRDALLSAKLKQRDKKKQKLAPPSIEDMLANKRRQNPAGTTFFNLEVTAGKGGKYNYKAQSLERDGHPSDTGMLVVKRRNLWNPVRLFNYLLGRESRYTVEQAWPLENATDHVSANTTAISLKIGANDNLKLIERTGTADKRTAFIFATDNALVELLKQTKRGGKKNVMIDRLMKAARKGQLDAKTLERLGFNLAADDTSIGVAELGK
ncbi:MAG: hypothetical protein H6707_08680 [Deltaproteobacteria bacterium]|nr:hypothetical protein [Deltaproteobacteria bacterium]